MADPPQDAKSPHNPPKEQLSTWRDAWPVSLAERGGRAPREGSGAPQGSTQHRQAGGEIHAQGPGGDGVALREDEVRQAPPAERLQPVVVCLWALSAPPFLSSLLLHSLFFCPSPCSPSNHPHFLTVYAFIIRLKSSSPHRICVHI